MRHRFITPLLLALILTILPVAAQSGRNRDNGRRDERAQRRDEDERR